MKTLLSIMLVALIGLSASADPGSKTEYVVTKDGKFVVAKVHFGLLKMHAKKSDGSIIKFDYKDVSTYKKNGEIYEKKPLYNNNKNTGCFVFMKVLSWRNGYGLYCYDEPVNTNSSIKRYFIFKDGNTYWLEVDQKNSETINSFFDRVSQK